jgi:sugar lactone lactonase YvrE
MTKTCLVLIAIAGCGIDPGGDDGAPEDLGEFTAGVSTLSGSQQAGYVDGPRGVARFANPVNVAYRDGKVYVADFDNSKIRVVDAETGDTTTLIAQRNFVRPFALAFAPDGTLYVSTDWSDGGGRDAMAGTLWRIDRGAKTAVPIAKKIGKPRGITVLASGELAVADYQHHVIQIVEPTTGAVVTLTGVWNAKGMADGAGDLAKFSVPYDVVVHNGELIVADFENNRIRAVSLAGATSTLAGIGTAGFADGTMATSMFSRPQALAVAANGDLFVSDLGNFRIRRIRGDSVETVAGSGQAGHLDSDDPLAAELFGLEGIDVTPDGTRMFIAGSRTTPSSRWRSTTPSACSGAARRERRSVPDWHACPSEIRSMPAASATPR